MSVIEKIYSYVFSSSPNNGAFNRSADGSTFSTVLDYPIYIPDGALYCTLEVQSANIWYTTPNISIAKNNNTFSFQDELGANHTVTFPNGLYDLTQLQTTLVNLLNNIPTPSAGDQYFTFSPNNATQKVLVTYEQANTQIFWTTSTIRSILGFNAVDAGIQPAGTTLSGQNVAAFNTLTSFLIHAQNLINVGLPVNNTYNQVIANVFVNVLPGSLINYTPENPPKVVSNELIGALRSNITFSLTDQDNVNVDTNGEYWSFTIVIRYFVRV